MFASQCCLRRSNPISGISRLPWFDAGGHLLVMNILFDLNWNLWPRHENQIWWWCQCAGVLHKQLTKKRRHQCCQLFLEKIGFNCHFPKLRFSISQTCTFLSTNCIPPQQISNCSNHIFEFIFRDLNQNDKVGNTWMGERSETSGMEQSKEESWLL